ncbi:MAG: hypothetical protein GY771_09555, partial [bacterium]|nr:hypothetical protein [bacterium]
MNGSFGTVIIKPLKITLQILFALSLLTLSLCDCNGPTEPVYDGPWEKVRVPGIIGDYGIDFVDSNNGWVCGFGNVGHWDGSKWAIVKTFSVDFTYPYYIFSEIDAVSENDVWVAGTKHYGNNQQMGVFAHYDGNDWILEDMPDLMCALTVWMFGDGTGWGGGSYGEYYHDGNEWTEIDDFSANTFFFNSKTDGWACGMSSIYHWDGTEWTFNFSDSSVWFQDIYFNAPDDGWAVAHASFSGQAEHFHYDGSGWTRITDPIIEHVPLDAVHFVDSDWGWFIGTGLTYFYDGNGWTEYETGLLNNAGYAQSLNDIYCVNKNDVWVCCDGHEYFLHFTG